MSTLAPTRDEVRSDLRADRRGRRRRALIVNVALAVVVVALTMVTLTMGSVRLSARQVLLSLLGVMDNEAVNFVVQGIQWPQAKSALATGLALGLAGTLFQQLLRNPLASPDFVGISSGASVAAVAGIVIYDFGGIGIPALAVLGALVSSVLMYVLAWKDGVSGYRFILIGIGISSFMFGLVSYLLTHSRLQEAREAMHWLTGSVGQSGPTEVNALLIALAVLVPLSLVLRRMLRALELGDDTARVLGTRAELARVVLIAVAVVLTGLATAVAGPLLFVALVAGPIADRLLGPAAGGLLAAAAVGAAVVLTSDYIAVNLMPTQLPTGVITGAVGAPYLLWLLATTNREST
ncbi:MAG TPA: iron chelate uptake ABC transporter family permease subunit [Nocardioides sp.]|nr:iron chelate uptake ABC transporter family permease subunit [Nocardioides sp.]